MPRSFTQKPACRFGAALPQKDSFALVWRIERDVTLLPDDIVQEIVSCLLGRRALFLEEVTRTVLEAANAGVLRPRIGVLIVAKLEHAVPVTLQASLIARLDRIGSAAEEIAEVGAHRAEILLEPD
jgi:hypothetical protein